MNDIQICNLALFYIGHSEPISSLTEDTAASKACSRVYDITRENLLIDYSWNFAVKQATLTEVTDETSLEGYSYVYEYPDDCLRVLRIFTGSETDGTVNNYKVIWTEDSNTNVKRIVCNLGEACVEYVLDLQDEEVYPAPFCEALAFRVASQIAMPLTMDKGIVQTVQQGFISAMERAKYLIAREQQQAINKGNRYMTART